MTVSQVVRRRLMETIAEREATYYEIAKAVKVHPNTIQNFMKGKPITSDTLDRIWEYCK